MLEGRSHALLQEAGLDLVQILQEEGFYVTRRKLTAPGVTRRTRESFGTSSAIELPTPTEFDKLSERWAASHFFPRSLDLLGVRYRRAVRTVLQVCKYCTAWMQRKLCRTRAASCRIAGRWVVSSGWLVPCSLPGIQRGMCGRAS